MTLQEFHQRLLDILNAEYPDPMDQLDGYVRDLFATNDEAVLNYIAGVLERRTALVEDIKALREALRTYGEHRASCALYGGSARAVCNCGFEQVRAEFLD